MDGAGKCIPEQDAPIGKLIPELLAVPLDRRALDAMRNHRALLDCLATRAPQEQKEGGMLAVNRADENFLPCL